MAHPAAAFPKGFSYTDGATSISPKVGEYFTSILCIEDCTVTVIGTGIYVNNGTTPAASLPELPLKAGMIIYGRFSYVDITSAEGKLIAYYP